MSEGKRVWKHKKKGTLCIITANCKMKYIGTWKDAVSYQQIKVNNEKGGIEVFQPVYVMEQKEFSKKFQVSGVIENKAKDDETSVN